MAQTFNPECRLKRIFSSLAALLLSISDLFGNASDLAKTINYNPPPNFVGGVVSSQYHDPGDNPFSLTSQPFILYSDSAGVGSSIFFQVGLVGAYIGEGKVLHFVPVTPQSLKTEIENEYKNKFSSSSRGHNQIIDGLNVATLSAIQDKPSTNYLYFYWFQVQSNIALKVTARASDLNRFEIITNSLNKIRIDKVGYMAEFFKPPRLCKVVTNHLERIEVGHILYYGSTYGMCVFHTREGVYSFTAGQTFNPKDDLTEALAAFRKLHSYSNIQNSLRSVIIGIAPGIPQTDVMVIAETNPATIMQLQFGDLQQRNIRFGIAPITLIPRLWENEIPQGFRKEEEFKVNAPLYVRTEPIDDE